MSIGLTRRDVQEFAPIVAELAKCLNVASSHAEKRVHEFYMKKK